MILQFIITLDQLCVPYVTISCISSKDVRKTGWLTLSLAPAVREHDMCLPGSSQLFDGRQDRQRVNLSSLIAQSLYLDWVQEGLTLIRSHQLYCTIVLACIILVAYRHSIHKIKHHHNHTFPSMLLDLGRLWAIPMRSNFTSPCETWIWFIY